MKKKLRSDEIKEALKKGCLENAFVPTLCGSAFKNKGVQRVLDAVIDFLPSPTDVGSIEGSSVDDPEESSTISQNSVDGAFTALAFQDCNRPLCWKA
jgi:elongation factor G